MPQLWIVSGPNGAGKTTVADRWLLPRIPVVSPDTLAAEGGLIIEPKLWDDVHAILAIHRRARGSVTRLTVPAMLKGIVFGYDGRAISPWHTTKKSGRRYRCYIPQEDHKEHAGASGLPRLPAAELEATVLEQLRGILRSPALLSEMLPQAIKPDPTLDEAKVTVAMTRLDVIWDQLFPAEQARIVQLLVERVKNDRAQVGHTPPG